MKINIISIGKIKEKYLQEGINEYLKRLQSYCEVSLLEVSDESLPEKPNTSHINMAINKEGQKVLKIIKNTDYVIALDLNKKQYTSLEFASYLKDKFVIGKSKLTFVIGGSYGLSDELKKRANDSISLSNLTFLHQMTKLILLEQIYRSFKINNNEVYHK